MTFTVVIGILIGALVAFLINFIFIQKLKNRENKILGSVTTYFFCIVLSVLFSLVCFVQRFINSNIEEFVIIIENEIEDAVPGITRSEFDTEDLRYLVDTIKNATEEITKDESFGKFAAFALNFFVKTIPANTKVFGYKIGVFLNENGKISIDSLLQTAKIKSLKKLNGIWNFVKTFVILLFLIYLIVYIIITSKLKKDEDM